MTRRELGAGLAVVLLALGLRVAYVVEQERVLGLDVSKLEQTDNYVFAAWARTIAAGDLLCREQPHAYHHWTQDVAPEGRWLEWYGGPQTFHQAPLYPYFVAAVFRLLGDGALYVGLAQAVLGALACWFTFLLGLRTVSLTTGVAAGGLLALMGSVYFYDAFLLRDGPMALLVVLTTWLLDRAVVRGRLRDWLLAGACLGAFTLAKETGLALLVFTLAALALWQRHRPARLAALGAALVAGWLLVTGPAFARNVVVGAPTFKLSTRGPEVFVTGNARGQDGVGWDPPVATLRTILMDSNFSLPRTMALTVATHRDAPWGYLALLARKTAAFFNAYEISNNVNFYLHRAHVPTLRLGFVSLAFVAPAALLGLLLGLVRRRRLVVPYLMLGAISASVILLYVLGRFRVQATPLLALFAGVSVSWFVSAWRARRHAALTLASLLLALLAAWTWPRSDPYDDRNKNTSIMLQLAKIGNFEQALRYRDQLVGTLDQGDLELSSLDKLDTLQKAFATLEQAAALPLDSPQRDMLLGHGYTLLMPITKRGDLKDFTALAQRHFQRALERDPGVVGARHGLGQVAYHLENHPQHSERAKNFGPALSWFLQELRLHPEHAPSHRDAGFVRLAWDDRAEALGHFLRANRAGLAEPELLANMARLSADPRLRAHEPLELDGERVPVFDLERALAEVSRALELAPEHPQVLWAAADVYYMSRRYDEAIGYLEQLIIVQGWRRAELEARIQALRLAQERAGKRDVSPSAAPGEEGER